jgi:hypothetical protein
VTYSYVAFGLNLESKGKIHGLEASPAIGPGRGNGRIEVTTSAALALEGLSVLSEDIAALREREGNFWASPGYPRINLWPESAANLFGQSVQLPNITPNWEKQFLPLDERLAKFEDQERPLAAIYVLEERNDAADTPRMEQVSARDAALLIVQNTYMNYLLEPEQRAAEFDAVARLVSRVPVKRLVPSSNPRRIPALCALLQADAARFARTVATCSLDESE